MRTFLWTSIFWILVVGGFRISAQFEPFYFTQIVPAPVVEGLRAETKAQLLEQSSALEACLASQEADLTSEDGVVAETLDLEKLLNEYKLLEQRIAKLEVLVLPEVVAPVPEQNAPSVNPEPETVVIPAEVST